LRNVTRPQTADTFFIARPAINDSALVTVAVVAMRRGIASRDTVRANVWVKNPDAAPPGVDSLKVDTLQLDIIASKFIDSTTAARMMADTAFFPWDTTKMWLASVQDSLEQQFKIKTGRDTVLPFQMEVNGTVQLCAVMRNTQTMEFYPFAWYVVNNDTLPFYVPDCAIEERGWMPRLYKRYYPNYVMRDMPSSFDKRNEESLRFARVLKEFQHRAPIVVASRTARELLQRANRQRSVMFRSGA
jgi:hypothetical protein